MRPRLPAPARRLDALQDRCETERCGNQVWQNSDSAAQSRPDCGTPTAPKAKSECVDYTGSRREDDDKCGEKKLQRDQSTRSL